MVELQTLINLFNLDTRIEGGRSAITFIHKEGELPYLQIDAFVLNDTRVKNITKKLEEVRKGMSVTLTLSPRPKQQQMLDNANIAGEILKCLKGLSVQDAENVVQYAINILKRGHIAENMEDEIAEEIRKINGQIFNDNYPPNVPNPYVK